MIIQFAKPNYLILLALLPFVILVHFFLLKKKRAFALKFANFDALARVKGADLLSKNIVILLITMLMIILLSFSLAGMSIDRVLYSSASSFVIAIDSSRSMEATDIQPNRLEAAKEAAIGFVDGLPDGTRLGVISFSGNSFIEQEVTGDKSLAKQAINDISLSSIGGTDLGDAVYTASNLLKGEDLKSVILISDGNINVGTVQELIDYANDNGVIVHTIGIGTEIGGETSYGSSKVDKESLQAIAYQTKGGFFEIGTKSSLVESFSSILQLKFKKIKLNLTPYLSLAALILFVLQYLLINTRYRIFP